MTPPTPLAGQHAPTDRSAQIERLDLRRICMICHCSALLSRCGKACLRASSVASAPGGCVHSRSRRRDPCPVTLAMFCVTLAKVVRRWIDMDSEQHAQSMAVRVHHTRDLAHAGVGACSAGRQHSVVMVVRRTGSHRGSVQQRVCDRHDCLSNSICGSRLMPETVMNNRIARWFLLAVIAGAASFALQAAAPDPGQSASSEAQQATPPAIASESVERADEAVDASRSRTRRAHCRPGCAQRSGQIMGSHDRAFRSRCRTGGWRQRGWRRVDCRFIDQRWRCLGSCCVRTRQYAGARNRVQRGRDFRRHVRRWQSS